MGILADLSGNNPGVEKPDVGERKFLEIDMDNFDNRMAAIAPGVASRSTTSSATERGREAVGRPAIQQDGRFPPGRGGPPGAALAKLLEAREQLSNLLRYMDGKAAARDQIKALLADPQLMAALQGSLTSGKATDETE